MNVDTYKSALLHDVFVTLPSASGRATIQLVDELSVLALRPVRRGYEIPEDARYEPFARYVLTEIVDKGYATHGADFPAPDARP